MKEYQKAYQRITLDFMHRANLGHNGKVLSDIVQEIIALNIHELLGVKEEHIRRTKIKIKLLKDEFIADTGEYYTLTECEVFADLLLLSLEENIIPQSVLVIGSTKDSREEFERITHILLNRGLIQEVSG